MGQLQYHGMVLKLKQVRRIKARTRARRYYGGIVTAVLLTCFVGTIVISNTLFLRARPEMRHGPHLSLLGDVVKKQPAADQPAPATTSSPQQPANSAAPSPQPQSVAQYGIAAGGGLVYLGQPDLDVYFQKLKDLGTTWVRWDLDWSVVQPDNANAYDWGGVDRVAATAQRFGITSLAIITYAPNWAHAPGCMTEKCPPGNADAYSAFAATAVSRLKDKVKYWEIYNEPNYTDFWQPKPDIKTYAALLQSAYAKIKQADSSAFIVSGGLAAIGDETDGSLSPITFVKGLYDLGANKYFDAVAVHPYSYPATPDYAAWWNRWQQIEPIHQLMVDRGDASKRIWLTEFGAPTGGPGSGFAPNQFDDFEYGRDFMSESAQNTLGSLALTFYQQRASWLGPFFWYNLEDTDPARDTPENFFGLIRADGTKKPFYDTLHQAIAQP